MNELGITRNIVAIVGDAAAGCRVSRVTSAYSSPTSATNAEHESSPFGSHCHSSG